MSSTYSYSLLLTTYYSRAVGAEHEQHEPRLEAAQPVHLVRRLEVVGSSNS